MLAGAGTAAAADVSRSFWHSRPAGQLPDGAPNVAVFRSVGVQLDAARSHLAPARRNGPAVTLALPMPDGRFAEFLLVDSRTLPDALQQKYPDIISLAGTDGAGSKARVDVSGQGLRAMISGPEGVWMVEPELPGSDRYISYRRSDAARSEPFRCEVHGDVDADHDHALFAEPQIMTETGATQREFRAAVAANHNYVAAVCPGNLTVACGLAAVTTAMNRVNQVYETELGVHMTLVPNNDLIIYPTAAGDPYSNGSGALNENVTNLAAVIGNENFDIGHVFTTGSGGVAGLRVTCTSSKARGTTGLGNPTGDPFYIDYVSHEMGHQFGGNHTFNSVTSYCNGNRAGSAAYEPGSGSTIQGYAGICGADNLQSNSDPYFHAKSLEEINTWLGGTGGACAAGTPSDDAAPVIDPASLPPAGLTIPMQTPFALSAVATDADGDPLTYNWEQYDLGPATTLAQGDTGSGPIFRSFNATASGTRTFPRMETVLGAPFAKGEAWPATDRNLSFRVTVRDNHDVPAAPQFGRTVSANGIQIAVTTSAGPFLVTRPNEAMTWGRGEPHRVNWDVAGTDVSPVACASVAIDLSVDGGTTFDTPLAAGVPNTGSAIITVPAVADTTTARVRVRCDGNVFFDVSDVDFTIAAVGDPEPVGPVASVSPTALAFTVDAGQTTSATLTLGNAGDAGSTLDFTIAESSDACASTGDVAWLSASPTGGSVPGQDSETIDIGLDATLLGVGTHTSSLCVQTNDPLHALLVVPVELTVTAPADDVIFADGFEAAAVAQPVQDPSFEETGYDGGPNPYWSGSDTNPDADPDATPLYSVEYEIPTHTGDWTVWFGGWQGGAEVQTVSQTVTIPAGTPRYLNYWRFISEVPAAEATLSVGIDGTVVETVDLDAASADADFVARSIDIGAYADGDAHLIEFRFQYTDAGSVGIDGNTFIDDVTIDDTPATLRPIGPPRSRDAVRMRKSGR